MQHQMEVLATIYMVPNMTTLTKMIIVNIHFPLFCQMKLNGANTMFPFSKRYISEQGSRYDPKKNLLEDLNNVCRQPQSVSSTLK